MSKLGKKRKQWSEEGLRIHKFQNAIKHCVPMVDSKSVMEVVEDVGSSKDNT